MTATAPEKPVTRRTWLSLGSLLICLAGPFSFLMTLENPFLRATGASGFALLIVGTILGIVAARTDRRRWLKVVAGFNIFLLALFTATLVFFAKLPESTAFASLTAPPDFNLPDETGHPTKLSEAYSAGPVLLVFYRGFW